MRALKEGRSTSPLGGMHLGLKRRQQVVSVLFAQLAVELVLPSQAVPRQASRAVHLAWIVPRVESSQLARQTRLARRL